MRLGFIGVGIRGTLLMEAAAGIAGVEIKAAADCYKGHLDRARELITPAPDVTGDYKEILSRPDIDAVVIATPDHWHLKMTQEALAAGQARLRREADDPPLGGRRGVHRGRREERARCCRWAAST